MPITWEQWGREDYPKMIEAVPRRPHAVDYLTPSDAWYVQPLPPPLPEPDVIGWIEQELAMAWEAGL